jgi:hypothetical protein
MRWNLSSQQKDFFQKQQMIEFDELLTETQTTSLAESCHRALGANLGVAPTEVSKKSPEEIFTHGRDLSRQEPLIRKIVTNPHIAEIAAELTHQPLLKLAYDQVLSFTLSPKSDQNTQSPFVSLLESPPSLQEMSCFQDILCGLLICLSNEKNEKNDSLSPFSCKPGSGVFFTPTLRLSLDQLYGDHEALYLLIAYASPRSVYIFQPSDPNTHNLKKLGYVFGDRLSEKFHPTVYRR